MIQLLVLIQLIAILIPQNQQFEKFSPPPGTIQIDTNLFVDKEVITNFGWAEFVYYEKNIKHDVKPLMPDSNMTTYYKRFISSLDTIHKRSKSEWNTIYKYDEMPLTGITFEQVVEYCKWRSYLVNLSKNLKNKKCRGCLQVYRQCEKVDPKHIYNVEYRIPSAEDWEIITKAMNSNKKLASKIILAGISEFLKDGITTYNPKYKTTSNNPEKKNNLGLRCVASFVKN